jgi:molybdopterin molybdotransferase
VSETSNNPRKQALEFDEGRRIVIETIRPLVGQRKTERVPLEQAYGRILAEGIRAERDYPALARSLRDGYAVKAADLPGTLSVRGEVRAGDTEQAPILAGEALEIMTGAPVPAGSNAIVMVEHVTRIDNQVKIDQTAEAGQFINQRGAEATSGTELIRPERELTPVTLRPSRPQVLPQSPSLLNRGWRYWLRAMRSWR